MSFENNIGIGSARSIKSIDIGDLLVLENLIKDFKLLPFP